MQGKREDDVFSYRFRDIFCSKVVQHYHQPSRVQRAKRLAVLTNQVLQKLGDTSFFSKPSSIT